MNKTYEEILERMKSTYFNECGMRLDDDSAVLKRFEAVASELFALSCYGDYIFKQAFIQTATKDCLDEHGAVRDCIRKKASSAKGTLTFYVNEPAVQRIVIPQNTVCSVENSSYLQYATTESGAIEIGETCVTIPAVSLGTGYAYNASREKVTVMVNAPIGISGVRNDIAFTGGYDDESDSSYRDRIMKHYSIAPNGMSKQSVENAVLMLEFVTDCFIPDAVNPGEMVAVVATKTNALTNDERNQIIKAFGIAELTGSVVTIVLAQPEHFSLTVEADIRSGFDKDEIKRRIEDTVREICSACRIGRPFQLNTISKKLIAIDGISSFNVYSVNAYGETLYCGGSSYLHLNDLVVNCFDE